MSTCTVFVEPCPRTAPLWPWSATAATVSSKLEQHLRAPMWLQSKPERHFQAPWWQRSWSEWHCRAPLGPWSGPEQHSRVPQWARKRAPSDNLEGRGGNVAGLCNTSGCHCEQGAAQAARSSAKRLPRHKHEHFHATQLREAPHRQTLWGPLEEFNYRHTRLYMMLQDPNV